SGIPALMVTYPTSFYEDVDFDGVKDLIATPNIFAREFLQTNFRQSVWFYKNTGTTEQPTFASPVRNFLQRSMIDVGDNSVPAFFDADGDGDLDLFIACYTTNFSGSISYFENIGTQSAPSFKLINTDFHGIGSYNLINLKIAFADMNGDTKIDLVLTASTQFGNSQLFYFPNANGIGANFSPDIVRTGFIVAPAENICVSDVNLDGKNDLLVGKQNGALEYWENTQTASNPNYTLMDESYLGLGSNGLRKNLACTVADLNNDGNADLLLGDQVGKISIVNNFRQATDATGALTDILYNPIKETYISQNLGGRVWPTVANIFRSDKPAIIVGNTQGGIHILKPDESIQLTESPIIDVYPNPVPKATSVLTIRVNQPGGMLMLTALGQQVAAPLYFQAFQEYNFQLNQYSKGIYLLYFIIAGKSYTRKIMIN
ncbi:MAG TPA: T9SS type A sorting domain-containing protein, partial [Cyclobacteriaceae bacterium]|nr:T9SS type A sorting domain-containing protein [Cyclobacteriaceae bacterium]